MAPILALHQCFKEIYLGRKNIQLAYALSFDYTYDESFYINQDNKYTISACFYMQQMKSLQQDKFW